MQTVRRRLTEGGLHRRIPARKIFLTQQHKDDRIAFCLQYYNFDWVNNVVIFVDEKTFQSDKLGRKILYRRNNERYVEKNTLPNKASGRIGLGIWGWISSMGPGELTTVSGRMNGAQYVEILRDVFLPTVRTAYPEGRIYLAQDNSSIHSSRLVQEWLAGQPDVELIRWPAKSPDLNPIENVWGQMVLNWDPSDVRNKENLSGVVFQTWELLRGSDMCWNMVANMHSRVNLVLDNGGGHIPY